MKTDRCKTTQAFHPKKHKNSLLRPSTTCAHIECSDIAITEWKYEIPFLVTTAPNTLKNN